MKRPFVRPAVLLACLAAFSPITAQQAAPAGAPAQPSQEQEEGEMKQVYAEIESYGWTREGSGKLGDKAEIFIPRGYRFANGDGARKLKQLFGNPCGDPAHQSDAAISKRHLNALPFPAEVRFLRLRVHKTLEKVETPFMDSGPTTFVIRDDVSLSWFPHSFNSPIQV